jgi:hypothetical protein
MTTDPMPRHFRQTLAELELVSHGTTTRYNPSGGTSDNDTGKPAGESRPPHLHWQEKWHATPADKRGRVEQDAADDLKALRGHNLTDPHQRASLTVDQRVLDAAGYAAEHVAQSLGLAANHVRRIRQRAGQDPETGHVAHPATRETLTETTETRVIELHAQGFTYRQISTVVSVSKSTVERIIKKAA